MSEALTTLSEEEQIFRQVVRDFAEERLRPLAAKMDQEGKLDPQIVPWLFELGLMAIEIPEEHGGAGATFFMSILAIEEIARVDPAVAVVCDVQNTLLINALRHWATAEQHTGQGLACWTPASCFQNSGQHVGHQ